MKAKSIKGKTPEEIQKALQESMADGFAPTLAIVFISIKQDRKAICELLQNKGIDIIGATSAGEFTNGYQDEGTAVILLLELNPEFYTILFEDIGNRNMGDVAELMAKKALQKFNQPAFIVCASSLSQNGEMLDGKTLVQSFEKVVGPQVNLYGGLAGDDAAFTGTFVFSHQASTDKGIAALVLDEEKINLHGMAISGWKPLGIQRTVTRSEGRLLYEIDDQSAVDMYLKYLGAEQLTGDDKFKIFENVGTHYPFQVEMESGDPQMVTPMGIDREENALICESGIPEGSKFRFSMPPDFDIVETILKKANELKNSTQTEADALLIFSCIGRLTSMGPFANSENEGLAEIWKAPMAGFYTYGEFGRAMNGPQKFHSTTCSWVVLKEN